MKALLFVLVLLTSFLAHAEDPLPTDPDTPDTPTVDPQYIETLEISVGHNHICALTTAGVKCFGNAEEVTTKVPTTLKSPRNIETGNRFSCAIVSDGIRCWGEIPNSTKTDLLIPHDKLPEPKLLSVGYEHSCAVSVIGQILCWGKNDYNEINPPSDLKNITEISSGMNNTCVIAENQVVCWGINLTGTTDVPLNLKNPRNLTSGLWHHCVQTDEGIKCWGAPYKNFVKPNDPNINAFTSGGFNNCAIVNEGVKCWDESGKTKLIAGTATATKLTVGSSIGCATTTNTGVVCWKIEKNNYKPLYSFVPAGGISNIEKVTASYGSTCVYGDGGKLKCWGANFEESLNVPSKIPEPITQLSLGVQKTCIIKDSTLLCWGNTDTDFDTPSDIGPVSFVSSGGNHLCAGTPEKIRCWGENGRGALDIPTNLTNFSSLSAGLTHSCTVANNEVNCWGGAGLIKNINPPTKMTNPKAICTGNTFSCGIDDTGKVSCWGEQIPLTYRGFNNVDVNEVLNVPEEIEQATEITCGATHGCALYKGKIKCWGSEAFMPERLAPPKIENPRAIAAGWYHTCAVGDKGLVCWGKMLNMKMPDYSLIK
jgi:alpha-tubulin suppressor-like RCC1 family protein